MIVRSRVTTRCCTEFYARVWVRPGSRRHGTLRGAVKPSLYGQPQPSTHPHLFEHEHELTPGIRAQEYAQRRQKLMESLPDGSVVVAIAGNIKYMSKCESSEPLFYGYRIDAVPCVHSHLVRDSFTTRMQPLSLLFSYKFRQASDFWYLTGFQESNGAVLLGMALPAFITIVIDLSM